MALSGINTLNKPYLLFYDMYHLKNSLKICVKECPNRTLNSVQDLHNYHRVEGVDLCKYNFNYQELNHANASTLSGPFGPCPVLPLYARYKISKKCVICLITN